MLAPLPLSKRLGIVIVTRNRAERLLDTLTRLRALEARYPIVVVDNASTDHTPDIVQQMHPDIDIVRLPKNLGGGARNFGVVQLDRELIAFADDDSWWAPGSLAQAVDLFDAHRQLGLIMSRVLVREQATLDPCCELMSRSPLPRTSDLPGIPILGFLACGVVFRREPFLATGGFDLSFRTGGEEAIVAWELARAGWALRYVEEIVSHHWPDPRRNMPERYFEGICVDVWLTWMRRRPAVVGQVMWQQLRHAISDPTYRAGIRTAWPQIPVALRKRRPLPGWLEAQVELLERQRS